MGVRLDTDTFLDADNGHRQLILAAGSMLDHDAATILSAASAAGFDGVGLRLSAQHAVTGAPGADEIRGMADDLGLRVHDAEVIRIDAGWSKLSRPPGHIRELLETAARLGASAFLVVSDLPDVGATQQAVATLVEAASPLDLTVGLEYMAWTTPATPQAAGAMADATGCRVVVDVLHHVRVGAGADEIGRLVAAGQVAWVQLCDAGRSEPLARTTLDRGGTDHEQLIREARHRRLPPGHGRLPLAELLAPIPHHTVLSVEVQSDDLLRLEPEARAKLLRDGASTFTD